MISKIKKFQKDFSGLKLEEIGVSKQTKEIHFIFKKDKNYVGFSVPSEHITVFSYTEKEAQ